MVSCYKVVPDSNFLMIPFQFGIDIFEELNRLLDVRYEIALPECVLRELERLSKKEAKAKAALELAKKLPLIECSEEDVDEFLYNIASKTVIICTNDKNLKDKIRKKGSPVIYLRQRKYLDIAGHLK
ncbi:MAG: nucleotide-binding protein [Candidatus Hydrothermarchaeota archaeon]|nr:MAG: nucleotide-binding protein [Candidatus Hydrothermarchaeota archaeon]